MTAYPFHVILASISIGIPLLVGFLIDAPARSTIHKRLFQSLLILAFLQVLAYLFPLFQLENNMPLYHVYIFVEGVLLTGVFASFYPSLQMKKRWRRGSAIAAAVWLVYSIWVTKFNAFPEALRAAECLVLIFVSVRYFWGTLRDFQPIVLTQTIQFWIASGVLIYFSSNLLMFSFGDFLVGQSMAVFDSIWIVHSILNITLYLTYTRALICQKTN